MGIASIGGMLGSFLSGGISTAIGLAKDLLGIARQLLSLTTQFNDMAIATTRNMGGSFNQSIGLTKALIADTKELSVQYGVSAELLGKLQDTIIEKTGRAITMNKAQREALVQTNRILGEATQGEFIGNLADMGSDLSTANKAMFGSIKLASSMGLSARAASAAVAKNLTLANKLPFQNGVDGLTKMTMLSQRLKFNLESAVTGAAKNFNTIEDSINNAAKLQQLGGGYAAYGANPMTMLYEANNDPETMVERMTKMFSGKGTFDSKTGEVKMNGFEMQMMKAAAEAMGMNPEDAIKMNKSSIRNAQIESQMGGAASRLSDEQKAFVENQAQYNTKTGKFEVTYIDEKGDRQTTNVDQLTPQAIDEIQKRNALTTEQAIIQSAQQVVTVNDRIRSVQEMIGAYLAEIMLPLIPKIHEGIMWVAEGVQNGLERIFSWFNENMSNMSDPGWWMNLIMKGVGKVITTAFNWLWTAVKNFFVNIWKNIVSFWDNLGSVISSPIIWLGGQLLRGIGKIPGAGGAATLGEKLVEESEAKMKNQTWKKSLEGLKGLGMAALDISMFVPGWGQAIGAVGKAVKIGQATSKLAKGLNVVTSPLRGAGKILGMGKVGKATTQFHKAMGGGSAIKGYVRGFGFRSATIESNQEAVKQGVSNAVANSPYLQKGQEIFQSGIQTIQNGYNSERMQGAINAYRSGTTQANQSQEQVVPQTTEEQNNYNNTTTGIINRQINSTANSVVSTTNNNSTANSSVSATNNDTTNNVSTQDGTQREQEITIETINASILKVGNNIVQAIKGISNKISNIVNNVMNMSLINPTSNINTSQRSNTSIARNNYRLNNTNRYWSNTNTNAANSVSENINNDSQTNFRQAAQKYMKAVAITTMPGLYITKKIYDSFKERQATAIPQDSESTNVVAKEYDGKVQVYRASANEGGRSELNVNDINVNINGTIKLEAPGGKGMNVDINSLMDNYAFKKALIDMVSKELNTNVSGRMLSQDVNGRRNVWSGMIQGSH